MHKVLIISYYYSYNDEKSTAISMDSRIYGIRGKFEVEITTMNNKKKEHYDSSYTINEIYTKSGVGTKESIDEFIVKAIGLYGRKSKEYDVVIVHANTLEMLHIPYTIKKLNPSQKIIGYSPDPSIKSAIKTRKLKQDYDALITKELEFYSICDAVVVTNCLFKRHIINNYNIDEKKVVVIEHSYKEKVISEDETFNFVYIGSTYFGRKIDNLCLAFDEFVELEEKNKKYKLVISSTKGIYFQEVLGKIKNIDNFIFIDKIPFNMAQKIESSAFANINITLPIEGNSEDIYFPTKLAQFLSYDKPILTISNEKGFSSRLMKETNNYYAKNSFIEIVHALESIANKSQEINLSVYNSYSSESKSKLFVDLINSLVEENNEIYI